MKGASVPFYSVTFLLYFIIIEEMADFQREQKLNCSFIDVKLGRVTFWVCATLTKTLEIYHLPPQEWMRRAHVAFVIDEKKKWRVTKNSRFSAIRTGSERMTQLAEATIDRICEIRFANKDW